MSGYLVLIALMSLVLQSPVEKRNSDIQNIGHRNKVDPDIPILKQAKAEYARLQ